MRKKPYPTDLHDTEWQLIQPLLPQPNHAPQRGRPTEVDYREIVNALRYIARSGCAWDMLPHDFPPSDTVYYYFRKWSKDGTLKHIHTALHQQMRKQEGRSEQPTLGIIDSQSVKTTVESGWYSGFDGGKQVKGRKRHVVVDILGYALGLKVQDASIQDRDGAKEVLKEVLETYPSLELILTDSIYNGDSLMSWIAAYDVKMEAVKKQKEQKGFVVQAKRWLVERLFGWLERWRRLAKDYERKPERSESMLYLVLSSIMLTKLARPKTSWRQT